MAKKRIKPGDVLAIPLPTNQYGFGRMYREGCIAIYTQISLSIEDIPQKEEYQFIVPVYRHVLTSGEWEVVDKRPFQSEEDGVPPPMCILDKISGDYSMYFKGEITKSSKEECEELEVAAVWDKNHIIDRILGDDTWTKNVRGIKNE